MARPQQIDDDVLIERIAHVFRAVGYEGASLARLAKAAGMQKASLYHRFPGGKRQMADDVLSAARAWYTDYIFAPLAGDGTPAMRIGIVSRALETFYQGGKQACLLNLLSQPPGEDSPFAASIREMFEALIEAFAALVIETGAAPYDAKARAARVVALLHGSLVVARGLNDMAPFKAFTASLARELGIER